METVNFGKEITEEQYNSAITADEICASCDSKYRGFGRSNYHYSGSIAAHDAGAEPVNCRFCGAEHWQH